MEGIIKKLDDAQREAVFSTARHCLVAAPPGSGKTRVLAARFARLVSEGVPPSAIAAITFTCRAAREMSERVRAFLGRDGGAAHMGTFHGLGLRVLMEARPGLRVIGRAEEEEVLRGLGAGNAKRAASRISFMKNTGAGEAVPDDSLRALLKGYNNFLDAHGLLDLDDIVPCAAALLEEGASGALPLVFRGIRHILVDEYQDINASQARFLQALCRGSASLFAIGDPDQAIYSFRGSSPSFFMDFERDWPGAEVLRLSTNYRSREAVVLASEALIRHNHRPLSAPIPSRPGGVVRFVECGDEVSEARYVIGEIERRMGGLTSITSGGGGEDARFSDFAVLFRSRRAARALVRAFDASSLPYHMVGRGTGLGGFLGALREARPGPGAGLAAFLEEEGQRAGLGEESLGLLLWLARRYGEAEACDVLHDFMAEAMVYAAGEETGIEPDRVNLLTLHGAKGLEFRVVFIIGVEDGLIPLRRDDTDLEEERRLFYVGLTRAAEEAALIRARRRRLYGRVEETRPSPFMDELEGHVTRVRGPAPRKVRQRPVQKGLFE